MDGNDERCQWGVNLKAEKVTYCTDVEGHWTYFCNFVDLSGGLSFKEKGDQRESAHPPELVLRDGWHFVFGGDSCDKGPGTLRFLEAVVALKKKHPSRVHLILGNRDINKMRWTSELAQEELDRLTPDVPAAFWVNPTCRVKPWAYIVSQAALAEGTPEECVTEGMVRKHNTKAVRMRYHLKHDMGSDGEFEFRRDELSLRAGGKSVSDEEVIASYEESVSEGGAMRDFLRLGQIACLLGETLFVHGQVIGSFPQCRGTGWSVSKVPDPSAGPENDYCRTVDKLVDWVCELNRWQAAQVTEWIEQPKWSTPPADSTLEGWSGRGGSELIAHGTPSTRQPSVVYCRWLEADCMPRQYPAELSTYLKDQGVTRVVVGHTPHGNCPTVIPNGEVYVVMADTSYSNMKSDLAYRGDNRGDAVADVALDGPTCTVKGRTGVKKIAQLIDYRVPPCSGGDKRIGCVASLQPPRQQFELATAARGSAVVRPPAAVRYFIKARLAGLCERDESKYLLCNVDGFKNIYQEASANWVDEEFQEGGALPFSRRRTSSVTSHGEEFGHSFSGYDGSGEIVRHIFRTLDRDGDGSVTCRELLAACTEGDVRQALAWSYPNSTLEEAFQELDENNDGRITMIEFTHAVSKASQRSNPHDNGKLDLFTDFGMTWLELHCCRRS